MKDRETGKKVRHTEITSKIHLTMYLVSRYPRSASCSCTLYINENVYAGNIIVSINKTFNYNLHRGDVEFKPTDFLNTCEIQLLEEKIYHTVFTDKAIMRYREAVNLKENLYWAKTADRDFKVFYRAIMSRYFQDMEKIPSISGYTMLKERWDSAYFQMRQAKSRGEKIQLLHNLRVIYSKEPSFAKDVYRDIFCLTESVSDQAYRESKHIMEETAIKLEKRKGELNNERSKECNT